MPECPREGSIISQPRADTNPKYGRGRVVSLGDDKVSVEFPGGETRTFKREFVRRV